MERKKSQLKMKTALMTLFLIATVTSILITMPAFAHTPQWTIPTYAYITASPSPIGVNQQVTLVFWLDKVPPSAAGFGGDRWANLTISVTKPDGSKETLGPFVSDPVGSGYALYKPTQIGKYNFVFNFPGQIASLYHPVTGLPGDATRAGQYLGDNYVPSSAATTLVVQSAQVTALSFGLPTSFWIRPIEGQNTAWASVASNSLSGSWINYHYYRDGIAPSSGHIMWTKTFQAGGVVGGANILDPNSLTSGMTFYDGTNYENKFGDVIIMNGKIFYSLPDGDVAKGGEYTCVDLTTGETLWTRSDMSPLPSFAQLYDYESLNQHGVIPDGYLWAASGGGGLGGPTGPTNWTAYDAADGSKLFTLTNVPAGTESIGPNGEILRYVLNAQGKWLALWNNTAAHDLTNSNNANDTSSSNFYQWRPVGKTLDVSKAFSWNVTIPTLPAGSNIVAVLYNDKLIVSTALSSTTYLGTPEKTTLTAISLKPESRGTIAWTTDLPALPGNASRSLGLIDYDSRVLIYFSKETVSWTGYSMDTGQKLWGPTPSENPWNFYSGAGGALSTSAAGGGKIYSAGYSGVVYCYDDRTGALLWNYTNYAGLDAPYTGYPTGIAAVADGKVYLSVNEHSCTAPYWKGCEIICLDSANGQKLWGIYAHGTSSYGDGGFAVADGMLVYLNCYDQQIYCVGRGPSATTVDAPMTGVLKGQEVLIRGTVTDTSAGAKDLIAKSLFSTIPAVSDASQDDWMNHLYMQKALPNNVEGVKVHLTAIDPNGNYQDIGVATTDINGKYGLSWAPPVPGVYHVSATFDTTNSYWGSSDTTYFVAGEAPASPQISPTASPAPTTTPYIPTPTIAPTPTEVTPSPSQAPSFGTADATTTYITVAFVVIITAVALTALILRRRR